jgi:hypothetical protein
MSAVVVNTGRFGCDGGRARGSGTGVGLGEGGWEAVLHFTNILVFIKSNIGLCVSM